MEKLMSNRFVSCLLLLGLFGLTGFSGDSPAKPVEAFYTLYLKTHSSGLPAQDEERAMAPYLSRRLLGLIDNARSYQEAYKRQHPDDKPPWIEGCLFASVFEGPTKFRVMKVAANPDGTSTVTVHFQYDTFEWDDSVIVRNEAEKFVIDDFVKSGAGPFNPPGRLSEELEYREE